MRRLSSRQVAASSMSGLATGYLWRTVSVQRSLIASLVTCRNFPTSDDDKSRQNCQIRREIRKKNFRDNFFSDGNLSVSVSFNFFPLAFFLTICLTLYVPRDMWPRLDQWDRRCDTWCADTLRSGAAILVPVWKARRRVCRISAHFVFLYTLFWINCRSEAKEDIVRPTLVKF